MEKFKWLFTAGALGALLWWGYNPPKESSVANSSTAAAETAGNEDEKPSRRIANSQTSSKEKDESSSAGLIQAPAAPKTIPELLELARLKECMVSETCDYPMNDPKSYGFAVGQDMKKNLRSLAASLAADPTLSDIAQDSAREFMRNPDGHVQEAALEILSKLPPSPENLVAIIDGLRGNPADPLILEQASGELTRYLDGPTEPMVHQYFTDTLSSGALFTAQKAGVVVKDIITPQSVGQYREVLKSLNAGSTTARNLRVTIEEYDRRRSGG